MIIGRLISLLLLFTLITVAQSSKYEFDFQQVIGQIESGDLSKEEMGIYDGYEIPLYMGEVVQFLLYTEEFEPVLILASPNGETLSHSKGEQYGFAKISKDITESGEYILYVISKDNRPGQYYLQSAIGPESAFTLENEATYCDKISFILAHARASFQLLGENGKSTVELEGTSRRYLDREDGSYHTILFEGDNYDSAEDIFLGTTEKITACLDNSWTKKQYEWRTEGNYRFKDNIYFGKDSVENNLQVVIRLYELMNKNIDPANPISVELIFKIVQ